MEMKIRVKKGEHGFPAVPAVSAFVSASITRALGVVRSFPRTSSIIHSLASTASGALITVRPEGGRGERDGGDRWTSERPAERVCVCVCTWPRFAPSVEPVVLMGDSQRPAVVARGARPLKSPTVTRPHVRLRQEAVSARAFLRDEKRWRDVSSPADARRGAALPGESLQTPHDVYLKTR